MASTGQPETPNDLPALLNDAVLRLAAETRAVRVRDDRFVVKYEKGRRHLVATSAQWRWLQEFGQGRRAREVLVELISRQRCPPLRAFYLLVVEAVRQGILQTEMRPVPPPAPPAKWRMRIPGRLMRWLSTAIIGAAGVVMMIRPVPVPEHSGWIALGWLAGCAAASLGYALAACVVRSAGGEIYRPCFHWKTAAPRFRADLDDVRMCGRGAEIDAAMTRLAPPFLAAGAAALWQPELLLPLLCGLHLHLSPLWRSPLQGWLRARYSDPQLATTYDFVFARRRLFPLLLRARRQLEDRKYLLACAAATVAWLALVLATGCALWSAHAVGLYGRFRAAGGFEYSALAYLALLAVLVAGAAGAAAWIVFSHVRSWWREQRERRLRPQSALVSPETIAELLSRTVLFRELPAEDLQALARVMKPETHRARSFVVREGEPGDRLYLVVSGRLEVRRDFAPGRSEPVAGMVEGDVFGEIALLQGGVRTRSIRCRSASVLLALEKADFERLVLSRISRQAVEDAVQKMGFLQHIEWARDWSRATMAAFCARARFREFKEGDLIVEEGASNLWFYLVHRGELGVIEGGREVRRLKIGDPFGELSTLKGDLATAGVVVRSKAASCLMMTKADFLEFITRDFTVGLRLEELSGRRRGWPALAAE